MSKEKKLKRFRKVVKKDYEEIQNTKMLLKYSTVYVAFIVGVFLGRNDYDNIGVILFGILSIAFSIISIISFYKAKHIYYEEIKD